MRDITVLVTASGAPGTAALVRALRTNGERGVRVVGTDMSPTAVGRHFCDRFYVVPPGSDPAFVDAVIDIVRRENIDIVLPQSSFDLLGLAESRERFMATTVMVSSFRAISIPRPPNSPEVSIFISLKTSGGMKTVWGSNVSSIPWMAPCTSRRPSAGST